MYFDSFFYGTLFAGILLTLRYILISVTSWYVLFVRRPRSLQKHRLQTEWPQGKDYWREVKYSFLSFIILSLLTTSIVWLKKNGMLRIYNDFSEHNFGYFLCSILVLIAIHDTYFYWAHRLMHVPFLYRHVHKVHHESKNPSPLASFAFHPFETFFEFAFLIPTLMIVPVHVVTISVFLTISHIINTLGHLGYEVYPRWFWDSAWAKWFNTSTHHNLHHRYFVGNYGFYFSFWDKFCKTENLKTEELYKRVAR